ncbi:hypothetical protein, partial [Clostridium sp.]|uniref:hypothetical protein n=1 Tax=Clostridium sp. TaxID=1506 RepID=UPI003F29FB14
MFTLERLTTANFDSFRNIYNESLQLQTYDKDFFKTYDSQNFIYKFIYRRFLRLINYNNHLVGFIWYDAPLDISIRVWALYIDEKYIKLLTPSLFSSFNNCLLTYDAVDCKRNSEMLSNLGFKKIRPTILMELKLSEYKINGTILDYEFKSNNMTKIKDLLKNDYAFVQNNIIETYYELFKNGEDEELRCNIQNEIFNDFNRVPLKVEDIMNDIIQDYYIDGLSIFQKVNDIHVGYGQIVKNRNMFLLVNFG